MDINASNVCEGVSWQEEEGKTTGPGSQLRRRDGMALKASAKLLDIFRGNKKS
jgi:hypothetical protein